MTTSAQHRPQGSGDSPLYHISWERLAGLNRSATTLLAARRGPSCPSRQRPDQELTDHQALVDEIADYSADEDSFIRSEMPLLEITFRILLRRRNEPISLRDLHYELTERWSTPIRPINVSENGLRRILEADTYYGFRPTPTEAHQT